MSVLSAPELRTEVDGLGAPLLLQCHVGSGAREDLFKPNTDSFQAQ